MYKNKNYYLDLFQVNERQLERLAAEGLGSGGTYCDLFFESSTAASLMLKDGVVSTGSYSKDYGAGIRVLDGEKTGYAYTENTDPKSLAEAAEAAAKIAGGKAGAETAINCTVKPGPETRYSLTRDWRDTDFAALAPVLERLQEKIAAKDSRIVKIIVRFESLVSDILMFNSLGELTFDTRPMGILSASAVFSQDGKNENKGSSRAYRAGAEMITEALLDEVADEVVAGIDDRFAARRPKGGQMPVVMGAGASGILLHEAMGHAFEADFNRKGQSIFSGRIGSEVCRKDISIVDDGTVRWDRGSVDFDDEGVPGQKTYMVKDGVLTSYLHDRISAGFYGVSPTGNGRRESFRYAPIPRMRSTYMESGKADKESIIASVKKGIYVDQFSNGQVQIGEGDFTFFVKSGFLIENGRLTQPVKDINIIGNGPQALADIVAVGNDLKIDKGAWTCGKGQSCPVSCGIPTVLVSNLTVGGE